MQKDRELELSINRRKLKLKVWMIHLMRFYQYY